MENKILNVIFSSDDNYAQHLGVAIYSLLKNNAEFACIKIFIIDNGISGGNKDKLKETVDDFSNAKLFFIPFTEWKEKLNLNMSWDISISSYARLFVAEMLPKDVNKVLYIDCDMIICKNLVELWQTNTEGRVLAAVQDTISASTKAAVGVNPKTRYFNAGLLLINLQEWREQQMGKKCLDFITAHGGNVTHHDQGTLNGVLNGDFVRLPLRYNLMTIHYIFNREKTMNYYGEDADFYLDEEISDALKSPTILHFTPSFTSRPWCKDCKHPQRRLYWDNLSQTPWRGARAVKSGEKWYVRLINWKYRRFGK